LEAYAYACKKITEYKISLLIFVNESRSTGNLNEIEKNWWERDTLYDFNGWQGAEEVQVNLDSWHEGQ